MKRANWWLGLWMALGLVALMPISSALGETETVDGVTWIYTAEDGKATVTGATPASETMTIPSKLGGCAVTEIGYQAFQKNTKITVLSIPDSVKNIGESAFEGCTGLQAVTIGNSVTNIGKAAFGACSALSSLTLGKGVMSIGNSAFEYCTKLTVVKIPDSVTSIGKYAFSYCRGLTSVTIPDSVINIGIGAFEECTKLQAVTIGNSVTSIGGDAFYNCRGLTSVTIGNSVTSIGGHAFYKCTSLTSVAIPNSVTSIESDAFRSCSRLTSVTIGNSVTNIGDRAFQDCSGLTNVTIPDSVTSIGYGVFSGCSELNTLYVPASWKGTSMLDYAGVPEDCTVVYVVKEQSVTFDANGGTCGTSSRIYAVGQTYSSFPAATRERYAFAGWWTEATGGQRVLESDTVQAIETRTLYAHWTWLMAEQEVTFNPNGGICDTATKTYSVGGKYTPLPVAVSAREHYAFAGWWTSAEGGEQVTNTSTVTAAETRTLYAHWTLAEQVVTFNPNGGTCGTGQRVFAIGQAYGTLPTPTMPQHVFAGWWTTATGGTQVTDTSTVTGSETRTLFAHWTKVAAAQVTECILTAETGTCTVHFAGQAGVTYALQCRQELDGNERWTTMATTMSEADGDITIAAAMPAEWASAFYRVVAEGKGGDDVEVYLVVDMSRGNSADLWPVSFLADVPDDGWTDEYKTAKLVLRRIPAGSFAMGSPENELGHQPNEVLHAVTLSKAFYMGVFEVTQKQYQLVTGNIPSGFSGETRPVVCVSWDDIRGNSGWPASSEVSASSFIGRLREKTGLEFDLPTEAQWEFACRAGTATAYSYGDSADGNCMWYGDNSSSQTHEVGMKRANDWGLYDMHGNVWEWCLDWYGSYDTGDAVDPMGKASGPYRVPRGGSWFYGAKACRSANRGTFTPSFRELNFGFRLCCPAGLP